MDLIFITKRREYWVQFDPSAAVFEMFASSDGDDYLGAFDTKAEALAYAKQHDKES